MSKRGPGSGANIVVVGGGVAGLGAALSFSRRGHRVTVIERDPTPMADSADEAFGWDRRGAPQVRHSHAFLGRLLGLFRDHHPDVLAALVAEGARELRLADGIPDTITDFAPQEGDDELTMLACRRTTFEWVLRRTALAEGLVTVRPGVAATGLIATPGAAGGPITVTGVSLDDGTTLTADAVVVASGRRSTLPDWLEAAGTPTIAETVEDTGIVYLSRFYKLRPGAVIPPRTGPIGGDLGYLKYGVFAGDNDTFSITLATPTDDAHLRRILTDEAVFEAAGRQLVATAPYLDGRAEAITGVHTMAGLLNRWRELAPEGNPVAVGVHAIGDALLCTNPLYGRGCTTAFWTAHLLAEAFDAHAGDADAQARAYIAAVDADIKPWYLSSVAQDGEARRVAAALLAGTDPDADNTDPRTFMRSVFRDGLLPAIRTDVVVLRAFLRNLNLLTTPDALLQDADVTARVFAVFQDRENRPPEPVLGPRRAALLAAIDPAA